MGILALAAERAGLLPASARLLAFSDKERQTFGLADVFNRPAAEREAAMRVHTALGEAAFAAAWAAGAALTADAALELGRAVVGELQHLLAGDHGAVRLPPAPT